ncbi:glycoside hydrolase family 16 protein [Paenibacillus pinihumi]|uniref:glycoside hydrolase family 16 protein n=1 Tax=Paenibacillus pinihumi TaxID=669462 RepID=UPI00041DE304|nr:glycoside hydrolase family 16 protein [Paenibacillus pinihumi]
MEKLIWQQDFTDRKTDLKAWNIHHGNDLLDNDGNAICPGWGNGEQQFYTGNPGNLYIDENGLNLCARCETTELEDGRSFDYTSVRMDTKDHMSFCYGRLVVRAKLPVGQGLWAAIWLLPQDSVYGTWPASGEIDIMETKGRLPGQVSGTLHYGKDMDNKIMDESTYQFESGTINQFRDYTLEWNASSIRWLVDGHCYAEKRLKAGVTPFDQPFYLLLNLAVGGWYDNVTVDDAALPGVLTVAGIWLYE